MHLPPKMPMPWSPDLGNVVEGFIHGVKVNNIEGEDVVLSLMMLHYLGRLNLIKWVPERGRQKSESEICDVRRTWAWSQEMWRSPTPVFLPGKSYGQRSPFGSLSFSAIYKGSSDKYVVFLHLFFLGIVFITASCSVTDFLLWFFRYSVYKI